MENEQASRKHLQYLRRLRRSATLRLRSIAPRNMLPHIGKGAFGSGDLAYGFVSMVGLRNCMEDAVTAAPLAGEYSFFAVYDGHGGAEVAERCGERLHKYLEKHIIEEEGGVGLDWGKVMTDSFSSMDDEIELAHNNKNMGSAAVVVLVGKDDVVVAHCGDSRAMLYRNDAVLPLSNDHKPERKDEKERIQAAGGRVLCWNGWRVEGVLSTSRSLGDHYLRPYVTSEPEVRVLKWSDLDEFLIIGSDGLFDVMSNERACKVVKDSLDTNKRLRRGRESGVSEAAGMLVERALNDGSKDNISAIVVKMA